MALVPIGAYIYKQPPRGINQLNALSSLITGLYHCCPAYYLWPCDIDDKLFLFLKIINNHDYARASEIFGIINFCACWFVVFDKCIHQIHRIWRYCLRTTCTLNANMCCCPIPKNEMHNSLTLPGGSESLFPHSTYSSGKSLQEKVNSGWCSWPEGGKSICSMRFAWEHVRKSGPYFAYWFFWMITG